MKELNTDTIAENPVHQEVKDRFFSEKHILKELRHYLPTQTSLKDFIHHNSLHAFQSEKFYDAILV